MARPCSQDSQVRHQWFDCFVTQQIVHFCSMTFIDVGSSLYSLSIDLASNYFQPCFQHVPFWSMIQVGSAAKKQERKSQCSTYKNQREKRKMCSSAFCKCRFGWWGKHKFNWVQKKVLRKNENGAYFQFCMYAIYLEERKRGREGKKER